MRQLSTNRKAVEARRRNRVRRELVPAMAAVMPGFWPSELETALVKVFVVLDGLNISERWVIAEAIAAHFKANP